MRKRLLHGLLIPMIAAVGCSNKPPRVYPPTIDAYASASAAMAEHDQDGDGRIAGAELDAAPALKAGLKRLDSDGDGAVSAKEIAARIKAWQDSRAAIMSCTVKVTFNGAPLEGADVTIEPAAFLGDAIKSASGTTDENGLASLTLAEEDRPEPHLMGVHCGFYRARISKKAGSKETIPAKFNVETTIGIEAAMDAPINSTGIQELNLKS